MPVTHADALLTDRARATQAMNVQVTHTSDQLAFVIATVTLFGAVMAIGAMLVLLSFTG